MRFSDEGYKRVRQQVGIGLLKGLLRVDQVYAKYHHERLDLHHPRGGGPKYLEQPLMASYQAYLQRIANALLDEGTSPEQAMIDSMEALNGAMSAAAPIEFNNLRRSGNPRVYSNGRKVYDRPAWQKRLTKTQLRNLRRYRRGGRRGG